MKCKNIRFLFLLNNFLILLNIIFVQGCTENKHITPSSELTIAAVGDVSGYNILIDEKTQTDPLRDVRNLIDPQDIFLFNYEGTMLSDISHSILCMNWPRQSLLLENPQIGKYLHASNFPIATLANNHTFDCGILGIQDTVQEFSSRGIKSQGAGEDSGQACQPLLFSIDGFDIAVISYLAMDVDWFYATPDRPGVAGLEQCSGLNQITSLAATNDIVIVALHLHLKEGWSHYQPHENIALIKNILDAGADIVLAHGPHVPQGVLVQDGKLALLSLGNFLIQPDTYMLKHAKDSIITKISVQEDRIYLEILPLRLDESGRPIVAATCEASEILHQLVSLSSLLGTSIKTSQGKAILTVFR
jgi:hypothetical protein